MFILKSQRIYGNTFSQNCVKHAKPNFFEIDTESFLFPFHLEIQKKIFKQLSEIKLMLMELSHGPAPSPNEMLPQPAEIVEELDTLLEDNERFKSTVSY